MYGYLIACVEDRARKVWSSRNLGLVFNLFSNPTILYRVYRYLLFAYREAISECLSLYGLRGLEAMEASEWINRYVAQSIKRLLLEAQATL